MSDPREYNFIEEGEEASPPMEAGRWNFIPAPPPPPPPPPPPSPPPPPPEPPPPISCFVGETMVAMADGGEKRIDCVRVGDRVRAGFGGQINVVEAVDLNQLGVGRQIYRLAYEVYGARREVLLSDEHPFWCPDKGWVLPVPDRYLQNEIGSKQNVIVDNDGRRELWDYKNKEEYLEGILHPLCVGDLLSFGDSGEQLAKVVAVEELLDQFPVWLPVYSLVTSKGSGSMMIGGGLWAMAWPDGHFDYRVFLREQALAAE